ncbi:MAG: asparaginase [Solirubrobacterales bacterium]
MPSGSGRRGRVLILSLGGTIAMTKDGGGDEAEGVRPTLGAEDLVAAVPEIADEADIETEAFERLPGAHLGVDHILALAERIERAVADGVDGIVVTQGTDTIEETAFLLDLLLTLEQPVVITGAMRNPTLPGADGPANLLAATQVAASATARGLGALVVFNDELHAARYVRKTHTSSLATFESVPGPLGWVSEGRPRVLVRPTRRIELPARPKGSEAPVALLTISIEDDGRMLRAVPGLDYKGVVVEALGGAHVPEPVADAVEALSAEMPVVLTSRTGRGEVLTETYDFPGSERDLIARGAIPAGWLDGPKARALLIVLLRAGLGRDEIGAMFEAIAADPESAGAGGKPGS